MPSVVGKMTKGAVFPAIVDAENVGGDGHVAHEFGGVEADISGVVIGDIVAGTGVGTMALVTSLGHNDGDVLTRQGDGSVDYEAPAGGSCALLDGSVHTDTVADAVTRGSIIYGNATPKWDELAIGADTHVLTSDGTDVAWAAPDVVGPGASTDHAVVRWDGAGGDTLQDSSILVDDAGNLTMDTADKVYFRDADIFIHSNADGEMTIEADLLVTVGLAGDIELGDGDLHVMRPQTDEKIDLGDATHRFYDGFMTGKLAMETAAPVSALHIGDDAGGADLGYITMEELSASPAEPAAGTAALFLKDNGGMTTLYMRFNNGGGAEQSVAIAAET